MNTDYETKKYLGYVYDKNGYHNGAVELTGVTDVVNFVCNPDTISNDKMVTDIMDEHVLNTFGYFVDRFGPKVSNEEKRILLSSIMSKQEELFGEE